MTSSAISSPYAPLELLPPGAERQQQRALGMAQHRLGRVHDLVDEQQIGALDVDLVGTAFQGHEADDVLTPAGEAPGGGVRDESERLDHRQHPLARVRVDQLGSAHDPGHGGCGHSRHARDVIDGGHVNATGTEC
jgi:hypothetical protein